MLSILIPVYNYNILSLVKELHKQATKAEIDFEILCLDDYSNNHIISTNKLIDSLKNTYYYLSKQNNGIAVTRQLLVSKAKYEWVILIDADVKLKNDFYIFNYLKALKSKYKVIFGGICYEKKPPNNMSILRWKYGKYYEEIDAVKRNEKPYKITSAANVLIKKKVYNQFYLDNIGDSYGMDIFFGPQLKLNKTPVLHINNGIYHLGLENSAKYLKKIDLAIKTLLDLNNENKIITHQNTLLKTFLWTKKNYTNYLFIYVYRVFNDFFKKNLLSKNPNMFLLQLYKISYMCSLDTKSYKRV